MIPFISNPFPLFSFFHTGVHPIIIQKNPIDGIVWDVDCVFFLDLLLKEGWAKRILVMCSEDKCFCFIRDWFRFSAGLSWIRVKTILFVE